MWVGCFSVSILFQNVTLTFLILILILFLILRKYFFVNWSPIFRITTKENHGYFQVAYTAHDITNIIMIVIDPGYFRVAYTLSNAKPFRSLVIDPGYFRVAYTWALETSLCNKV